MTVTGGGTDDEQTRVDREPPSFPRVDDSAGASPTAASTTPLFTTSNSTPAAFTGAETSEIVSRPIDPPPNGTSNGRGSRLRWLVAGIATILVFAVVGGALFLAAPHSG